MDELKEHWIREVEEVVPPDTKPLSKDDEEVDHSENDNDDELDSPGTNVKSFTDGAFDNNNVADAEAQQLSFDFVQLDNSHNNRVDTNDLVNFNTSPFASALEMPFTGYDLITHATGVSDFTAQSFGDVNMYQSAFDENFSQHLVTQESALYLNPNTQMWS